LIKLTQDEILENRMQIEQAIADSLPPITTPEESNRRLEIFKALVTGLLQCWVVKEDKEVIIFATFCLDIDPVSREKHLLLYTLYGVKPVSLQLWTMLFAQLLELTKKFGCKKIIAYSCRERVIQLAKTLGWDTTFTFLSKEV
jgi:hypothetical protein